MNDQIDGNENCFQLSAFDLHIMSFEAIVQNVKQLALLLCCREKQTTIGQVPSINFINVTKIARERTCIWDFFIFYLDDIFMSFSKIRIV